MFLINQYKFVKNINMVEEYSEVIDSFKNKIDTIVSLYEKTKEEKLQLTQEKSLLINELEKKQMQINELEEKYKNIKLAKALVAGDDESHEAKLRINRIVREIDNCIALLNR